MSPPTTDHFQSVALRQRVTQAGVPLFGPLPTTAQELDDAKLARLIVELLDSADERLIASIPCLLATHSDRAAEITTAAAAMRPQSMETLGFLHWLARCLIRRWATQFELLYGVHRSIGRVDFEPVDVPAPEDRYGECGIGVARDLDPPLTRVCEQASDDWIAILWKELRGPFGTADQFRAMLALEYVK